MNKEIKLVFEKCSDYYNVIKKLKSYSENLKGYDYIETIDEIIKNIESGKEEYYIDNNGYRGVKIIVIRPDFKNPYLRTEADTLTKNNLDELPDMDEC
jgi:hypothetical protein